MDQVAGSARDRYTSNGSATEIGISGASSAGRGLRADMEIMDSKTFLKFLFYFC